jgi:hypothetical protein
LKCDARGEEITEDKGRITELQNELSKSTRELDISRRDQSKTILRLEREKNALVDKIGILETTLATERLKVINADEVKKVVTKYSDEVKESYDFYREFYEKQTAVYDQFLAPRGAVVGKDE